MPPTGRSSGPRRFDRAAPEESYAMELLIRIRFWSVVLLFGSFAACDAESSRPEGEGRLPAAVERFVGEWFPEAEIVDRRTGTSGTSLRLSDGTCLEFDAAEVWRRIENLSRTLPVGLVAEDIGTYLETHYPAAGILRLERDRGYRVGLDNGVLLVFDADTTLVEVLDCKVVIQNPEF